MATNGTINTNDFNGRYLAFSWALSSQDVETNTSIISWSLRGAGNSSEPFYNAGAFKVVIDGVTVFQSATRIKLYNNTLVSSGSFTINHEPNGSKTFTASVEGAIYYNSVNVSGSASFALPQIDRYGTIISAVDFTDEQNPSLTFTNPNNYTLKFELVAGNLTISRTVSSATSPYIFELSDTERNNLRAKAPNSNTLAVTVKLKTIEGGTTLKTDSAAVTMQIVNANPIITGATYSDVNATTTAITGDSSKIIQGKSLLELSFVSLTAIKGATLSSIVVSINSVFVSSSLSGTSTAKNIEFGVVNSSRSLPALVTLTDSRGNSSNLSLEIDILSYSAPTALISCKRLNNSEADISLLVNASYSALGGSNTLSIDYQYKEITASTYSAKTAISDGVETLINLDRIKAYNFRVTVEDLLESTVYDLTVDKGIPIFFVDRLKRSIGVNCFPRYSDSIEINGVDFLSFHAGDTSAITSLILSGSLADSSQSLKFSVPIDKAFNQVAFTSLSLTIIGGGSQEVISEIVGVSGYTITTAKASDKILTVEITKSGGFNLSNLSAVSVELSASLLFS